jgi:UDP-N-acetylmuramoyl-tripeptide--D-alanyl-D-alanine ligase
MDTATAARAMAGTLSGANVDFSRVTTDSRSLEAGDLFVALKGERFDGHDFVVQAFERGAAAAVVAADRAGALVGRPAGSLLAVADPLAALGALAAFWRRRFILTVVGVVGSNGKTTVKEMTAAILRAEFGAEQVLATAGNLNNEIGLPLTVLGLRAGHRAAVIEIGMNHPGETAALASIAQPTITVINNAQREHQEFMKSVADVAAEHAAALNALPHDGISQRSGARSSAGATRKARASRYATSACARRRQSRRAAAPKPGEAPSMSKPPPARRDSICAFPEDTMSATR